VLFYPIPFGGAERNRFLGDSKESGCLRFFDTAFDQAVGGSSFWLAPLRTLPDFSRGGTTSALLIQALEFVW
jgi:hypothetical protein